MFREFVCFLNNFATFSGTCDVGYSPRNNICYYIQQPGPQQPQPFPSGVVSCRVLKLIKFFFFLVNPGEICDPRCDYTNTCSKICAGGSICIDEICTCRQGHYAINGQCYQLGPQVLY